MTQGSSSYIGVVEDDTSYARALERLMRSAGFQAKTYASGEDFLRCGSFEEVDCLVLDIHMPGLSGFDVAQSLSDMGHCIPTIFITALDDEDKRKRAMRLGAIGYLSKPFNDQSLLDALHWATGKEIPLDHHEAGDVSCEARRAKKEACEGITQKQKGETT